MASVAGKRAILIDSAPIRIPPKSFALSVSCSSNRQSIRGRSPKSDQHNLRRSSQAHALYIFVSQEFTPNASFRKSSAAVQLDWCDDNGHEWWRIPYRAGPWCV